MNTPSATAARLAVAFDERVFVPLLEAEEALRFLAVRADQAGQAALAAAARLLSRACAREADALHRLIRWLVIGAPMAYGTPVP